ncbi:unnamed protein product [Hyaloperonospora brassicae]|uniref:subtilisin n=1 Tax=Hyaloperonospora brassicae TaxID=162125 RepID=A0AAV0UBX0_HYABA|nr:unnamed protein product [Hyaloperonospora brassicae]
MTRPAIAAVHWPLSPATAQPSASSVSVLLTLCLFLAALLLTNAAPAQSKRCHLYANATPHEYIAHLRAHDTVAAQEQLVSALVSSAASHYSLESAARSDFARQAPTDFVVLRLFDCDLRAFRGGVATAERAEPDVCLTVDSVMQQHVETNARGPLKAVRVNYGHRNVALLGVHERQEMRRRNVQTATSKLQERSDAKEELGLQNETALLVDKLGARELWKRGYAGRGVKIGIFDTGLSLSSTSSSAQFRHVAEQINWTHEPVNTDVIGHGTFVAGVMSGTTAKCPGIAPEAELFVFRMFTREQLSFTSWKARFPILKFVDKVRELTANGIIPVSAVGSSGPHYGMLSNPADQVEVMGVGGITRSGEVADFSPRSMTTWELPFGSGRVKPDIVTFAEGVLGADVSGRCKTLSGTSASAPIVSAAISVLASMIPAGKRWSLLNAASMKQILLESSDKLVARHDSDYAVRGHIFEQGGGVLNMSKASEMPLYHKALPLVVNLTILNPASVGGVIKSPPQWIGGTHGEHLAVSTSTRSAMWPYIGSVGVFNEANEQAAAFEGIAEGLLRLEVDNGDHVDDLLVQIAVRIIPSPQASKRILWEQFRNIPYPSAFVPRDNLENQHDLMDVAGDHPHTNFHQMWSFLTSEGFFVEVLPFEYSCLDLSTYGVMLVVDPEEEFFRDEIVVLQAAVKNSNVSLIIFADWYDNRMLDSLELYDTSTLSKWRAITGGANVLAINGLLQSFHIAFGNGVVHSTGVSLFDNNSSFPYWSVLGLYEVPSRDGGRIAVFGDSSCLDSSAQPATEFRHCFGMLRFTNDAVDPFSIVLQSHTASTRLQRLELEFVADEFVPCALEALHDEGSWHAQDRGVDFAKHSKVVQANKDKWTPRSFCKFYAKERCVDGRLT